MSAYDNVVVGKLKLKGKPLDVKSSGLQKKRKKKRPGHSSFSSAADGGDDVTTGGNIVLSSHNGDGLNKIDKDGDSEAFAQDDRLTRAERRYLEQTQKLELQRLAKVANKLHRDRIHEFNQYLANLTEHYDIPKVGPG